MLIENKPIVIILNTEESITENGENLSEKTIYRGNGDPLFLYNELLMIKKYIDSTIETYVENQYTDDTIHNLNESLVYKPQGQKFTNYDLLKIDISNNIRNKKEVNYVYLMLDERSMYHKIGISKNPQYRERTLQSENPNVVLTRKWVGTKEDEFHLHKLFENKRIRGEWFNLDESDLVTIKNFFESK